MKGIPGRRNQTVKNKISEGNCQGQGTKKTKQNHFAVYLKLIQHCK